MGDVIGLREHRLAVDSGYRHEVLQSNAVRFCDEVLDLAVCVLDVDVDSGTVFLVGADHSELDGYEHLVLTYHEAECTDHTGDTAGGLATGCACGQGADIFCAVTSRAEFFRAIRLYRGHQAVCRLMLADHPSAPRGGLVVLPGGKSAR